MVGGGWLALAGHYLMLGGVAVNSVEPVVLGLAALAGWACVITGGIKFASARRRLRSLRRRLEQISATDAPREAPEEE